MKPTPNLIETSLVSNSWQWNIRLSNANTVNVFLFTDVAPCICQFKVDVPETGDAIPFEYFEQYELPSNFLSYVDTYGDSLIMTNEQRRELNQDVYVFMYDLVQRRKEEEKQARLAKQRVTDIKVVPLNDSSGGVTLQFKLDGKQENIKVFPSWAKEYLDADTSKLDELSEKNCQLVVGALEVYHSNKRRS